MAVPQTEASPFAPTAKQRREVLSLALSRVPPETIARITRIDLGDLRYHFRDELELAEPTAMGLAAARVLDLLLQDDHPTVALNAAERLLMPRERAWRVPKAEAETVRVPVEQMTLEQVEAELARLGPAP